MHRIILSFLLIFLTKPSFAQNPIIVKEGQDFITLADKMHILIDSSGKMTIKDILKTENQKKFIPNFSGQFLYSPSGNYMWLKFKIKNESNQNLWGDIVHALAQEFDFYTFNQENKLIHVTESGFAKPMKDKPNFSSHYVLPFNSYSEAKEQTFYIRIYNKFPIIYIPRLGIQDKVLSFVRIYDYRTGIYLGLMLVMILYNTFIGYITKERVYLYYVLFLIYIAYAAPYQLGDLSIHSVWFNDIAPVTGLFGYLLPTLFAFRYLDMKNKAYRFYIIIGILTGLLVSVSLLYWIGVLTFANYLTGIAWLSLLYNPILWAVGVYLWFKGVKNARFYTIAWTSALGVSLLFFIVSLGILPYGEYINYGNYIGFSAQVVLFSIALGDRMNTLQREKEEIQKENLLLVEEQKETLEQKVQERTFELQEANEELQVMNEELHQSQEELASQRDFIEGKNRELSKFNKKLRSKEEILRKTVHQLKEAQEKMAMQNSVLKSFSKKIQSSIKSAESIQKAILPYQEELDTLLGEYFVINRPKDVVSGDFYWLNKVDNKVVIIVADCTGHGVPGAFMTLIGSNLLDKIVRLWEITSPSLILEKLHEEIHTVLRQKETENNSGMDLVAFTIEEENDKKKICFSGAKNSLFYFNSETRVLEELRGTRKSVGGIQNQQRVFEERKILLSENSILYAGSDGLEDQNDKRRRKFGKKRLKQVLEENVNLSLIEQGKNIELRLDEHMRDTEQRDDILLMGIKL